jgi:pilus assembly protein Flp/PilA
MMDTLITSLYVRLRSFVEREEGQDLVEYSLVVAMIALGAASGMQYLASGINVEFSNAAAFLSANTT